MKTQIDISCELYNTTMYKEIGDDYIFKKCIHEIIEKIDINELKRFFEMIKIDPNSKENKYKLSIATGSNSEIYLLEYLKQNHIIRFEVKLK